MKVPRRDYEVMLADGRPVRVCEVLMIAEGALSLWLDKPAHRTPDWDPTVIYGFVRRNADMVLSPTAWLSYRYAPQYDTPPPA